MKEETLTISREDEDFDISIYDLMQIACVAACSERKVPNAVHKWINRKKEAKFCNEN